MALYVGLLIPALGAPQVAKLEVKPSNYRSLRYLKFFGYHISYEVIETSEVEDMGNLNHNILKEYGDGLLSPKCFYFDKYKHLTMNDAKRIIEIAKAVPTLSWLPPHIIGDIFMISPTDSEFVFRAKKKQRKKLVNSGLDMSWVRETWDAVKSYYIPPMSRTKIMLAIKDIQIPNLSLRESKFIIKLALKQNKLLINGYTFDLFDQLDPDILRNNKPAKSICLKDEVEGWELCSAHFSKAVSALLSNNDYFVNIDYEIPHSSDLFTPD